MSATGPMQALDDRVARLERSLAETIDQVELRSTSVESRVRRLERTVPAERPSSAAGDPRASRPAATPGASATGLPGAATPGTSPAGLPGGRAARAEGRREWDPTALSDLVGGRILAWVGGLAVLVGIVLFLVLAVSHGWIGETARVVLAGAASGGLLAAGVWLRGHRGRTEAATTMVGAGTAGLFATLVVAGEVYRVVPPLVCLGGATVVGALATTLAIRWAGRAIAALGLGGALLAPVLVGAPSGFATLGVLGVTTVFAMGLAARENWRWLGLGALVLSAPQWAAWTLGDRGGLGEAIVLGGFALVGLAGGVAGRQDTGDHAVVAGPRRGRSVIGEVGLIALNACVAGVVGYVALQQSAGHASAVLWLAGLCGVHAAIGLAPRFREIPAARRQVLIGLALVFGDVAFGLSVDGLVLTGGWAAVSVGLAWAIGRRAGESRVLEVGLGGHVALVLIRVILAAPPDSVGAGPGSLVALLSISTLAASALACAQLSSDGRPGRRTALNGLGLISIAYLTAGALDGAALAAAWAVEGGALMRLSRSDRDDLPWFGGLGFVGLAAAHAFLLEAPPAGLLVGLDDVGRAVIAVGAIVCATFTAGRLHPAGSRRRMGLHGACGLSGLYLISVTLVSLLDPQAAGASQSVLDLGVRQQAQVALSGFWSLAGLAALTLGLRRRLNGLRIAGLGLLFAAVGKVFTYDLSALDSIYRVASVLTLGLLLLIAAVTYQRLRPPPVPDLRTLHPSQR